MKSQILISFIVPVYNAAKHLETTIQSVISQQKDWIELVLINDGSTDESYDICKKYESKQVRCISTENMGAGHARNVGIDNARGKWIGFLDSDDLILGGFFDEKTSDILNLLNENNVDIIYTPKIECDFELRNEPVITYPEDSSQIKFYMPGIEFWSCLYQKEFLKNNGIRFFEYKIQDVESAFRFRSFSKANNILTYKRKVFYLHRDNPNSNVNTWNFDNVLRIKALVYSQLAEEFSKPEPEVKQWLLSQSIYSLKELLVRCLKLGMWDNEDRYLYETANEILAIYQAQYGCLKVKYKILTPLIVLLFSHKTIWRLFVIVCRKRRSEDKKNPISVNQDNIELIMERLHKFDHRFNSIRKG